MAAANRLPRPFPNADNAVETSLQQFAARTAFTISSSREPDMPIIYVSQEFCKLTGYAEKEILGRNCRFLQGPGTSRQAVQELRNCIQEDRGCTVCLMNYTKDGKPFWNQLCLAPIRDEEGVSCYLGIQTNVTGAVLAYRSQQFSPFPTQAAGPHGGVHSFTCPDIVVKEMEAVQRLEGKVKRWHSEKIQSSRVQSMDFRPISAKSLPSSLLAPLHKLQQSFVLADPNIPDMPIVHASEGFLKLTGRPRSQVVGHNCRFMQGPLTDQAEVQRLRDAIKEERPITVRLLNYRSNGDLFWNHLHVAPIRNADGKVVYYVGCQLDITIPKSKQDRRHSTDVLTVDELKTPTIINPMPPVLSLTTAVAKTAQITAEERTSCNLIAALKLQQPAAEQEGKKDQLEAVDPISRRDPGPADLAGTAASKQLPEALQLLSPASKQQQRSVIGTVRVVCRSLSTKTGLRRSLEDQHLPHGVNDCSEFCTQPGSLTQIQLGGHNLRPKNI